MQTQDPAPTPASTQDSRIDARTRKGRIQMLALLLVCASPVIASYLTYYVFKPTGGSTNYGALVEPQRPMPAVNVRNEEQAAEALADFKGKWLLVTANGGACDEACAKRLFTIRQLRAGQGKNRERIVPVWLVTDDAPIDPRLKEAYNEPYAGVRFLHMDGDAVRRWLPPQEGERFEDTLYLIDPLGNLMMRFPKDPDPKKVHSDLDKLLKYSHIG